MIDSVAPWPVELRLQRRAGVLQIDFDDGATFDLPASLLRAMTPSAAERGHGCDPDSPIAKNFDAVLLLSAEPVGAYAIRLAFDDGHDTGLYTWQRLYGLGQDKIQLMAEHQRLLQAQP